MEPKIRAILWYLDQGGKEAIVTDPAHITAALRARRHAGDPRLEAGPSREAGS
jgi:carbamate kinase